MSINKSNPEVQKLVEEIESVRRNNPEKHLDLSLKLFELAEAGGNEDLKDYANCILGDACVFNQDFFNAIIYLSDGINGLKDSEEYELICRSYNELGVIYHRQGHYMSAEEAFIECIRIAKARRLYLYESLASANLSSLCAELDDVEDSMEYRYRAVSALQLLEPDYFIKAEIVADLAYIVRAYCVLGNRQKADEVFHDIQRRIEVDNITDRQFELAITKVYYYNFTCDRGQEIQARAEALEHFYSCEDFVVYYDECMALFRYMLKIGDFDEVEKMIVFYESCLIDEEMLNQYISVEEIKVHLYEARGPREKMLESAYRCFELNLRKTEDIKKTFKATIQLQKEITDQKTKNIFMSAQTETDPLTGLANRRKLNVVVDELFIHAYEENKSLGVEVLDIDDFKNINEDYGQKFGDEVLIEFANGLKSLQNDKVFVARHRKNQFVIFYYDYSDEEIIENAKQIKELSRRITVEMGLTDLTVSQGILNCVPNVDNNSWDFMSAADETLYFVKCNGKGDARLINHMWDLKDKQWEKFL